MLRCIKSEGSDCEEFESASTVFIDNLLVTEAAVKTRGFFPEIGRPGSKGSVTRVIIDREQFYETDVGKSVISLSSIFSVALLSFALVYVRRLRLSERNEPTFIPEKNENAVVV